MSFDIEQLTTPLRILKKIVETPDSVTLEFEVPKDSEFLFKYSPGQFLTLFLEIDGEVVPRSYSICSTPQLGEPLRVTVKRVKGGIGSNFILDRLQVGASVRSAPPAGHFFRSPARPTAKHWFLAGAGSGITPLFSILKTVLNSDRQAKVTLLYSNRDPQSTIYRQQLEEWQAKYADRFKIIFVYSKTQGRCEGPLLEQILKKHLSPEDLSLETYLCGPQGFMKSVRDNLLRLKIDPSQIHEENFATVPAASVPSPTPHSRVFIGDLKQAALNGLAKVEVTLGRENIQIEVGSEQNILEALIQAGHNPPYSCLEGNCMACVAKITKGRVFQNDPGILLDENMAAGETLTCQCFPDSAEIHLDFDSL